MDQPYFVRPSTNTEWALSWYNSLGIWMLTYTNTTMNVGIQSYCSKQNILECDHEWYVLTKNDWLMEPGVHSEYCKFEGNSDVWPWYRWMMLFLGIVIVICFITVIWQCLKIRNLKDETKRILPQNHSIPNYGDNQPANRP